MMQSSSCTNPAAFGLPPNPTDWLAELDSATHIPCSTASRIEPPRSKTFKASSLDDLPNDQVETIKGKSPFSAAGSAASATLPDILSKLSAVLLTNCLRDRVINGCP